MIHCSETYSQKNVRMSIEESLEETARILQLARAEGVPVSVGLTAALGCPYEGEIPPQRVVDLIRRLVRMG